MGEVGAVGMMVTVGTVGVKQALGRVRGRNESWEI